MEPLQSVRIDQWLWAARFFKTRSLAQQAIRGGKIHINGHRCKPARTVQPGDHLNITRGEETFAIDVLALSAKRGPATMAQALYRETPESIAARQRQAGQRRLERAAQTGPVRRPDKRQRRQLRRLKAERVD